ncbi:MAG: hypothetical protein FWB77_01975 [Treponema sp.]|nr:hypothetical protein [Treponema sp.]
MDIKNFIERARKDGTIMILCHHEYLGDYGNHLLDNWEPSDEEVLKSIKEMDIYY